MRIASLGIHRAPLSLRAARSIRAALSIAALLGACTGTSTARTHCGSARIGPEGGTVTGANGATLLVPAGTLVTGTDVRLCVLEIPRVPGQHADAIEIAPAMATLSGTAAITIPVDGDTPTLVLLDQRETPTGARIAASLAPHEPGAATVTGELAAFGVVRVLENDDADAGVSVDAARIDAPPALGPVAVGPDLLPADYTCLGARVTPRAGELHPVTVRAIDWENARPCPGDTVCSASSAFGWQVRTGACATAPDCATGVTDARGEVLTPLRTGPSWISFRASDTTSDPDATPFPTWVSGLSIDESTTTLEVPVLAYGTGVTIQRAVGMPTRFALGRVVDCAGRPVQRARVVAYDSLGSDLGDVIRYGNGAGSIGAGRRTSGDGMYALAVDGYPGVRLEAWGVLALGGPEVLIACDEAALFDGAAILDLWPLRADAGASCGAR